MRSNRDHSRLRYIDASNVLCRAGGMADVDLVGVGDEKLGHLNGVLIDPVAGKLQYYVVESPGWLNRRQYLLPTDMPARVDPDGRSLHVDIEPGCMEDCETFERASVPPYSPEDAVDHIFREEVLT